MAADRSPEDRRNRDDKMIDDLRANGGRPSDGSSPRIILETIGAKTGCKHVKPVCVREDGPDLVVAATAGGQPEHPQWYRNLAAHPQITVEYLAESRVVRAVTVSNSADRDRLFEMMSLEIPGIYGYQDRCRDHRQIPVIRLVRM